MATFPSVDFTTVSVAGLNGPGVIDLAADGTVMGPFAPAEGDQVIAIREGVDTYAHDDVTDFASLVGNAATLQQYSEDDLSSATLVIVLARLRWATEDQPPVGVEPSYFAVFTTVGLQRLAEAQANADPLVFAHMAVGDGGGSAITPSAAMTALVNEMARVPINNVDISPDGANIVRVEGLIPAATGSFWIREAGLFNVAGELIAVASYPPIWKPIPAEGVTVEEYIRILLQYESAAEAIALTVDPDVIVATRLYVDDMTAGGLYIWEHFT